MFQDINLEDLNQQQKSQQQNIFLPSEYTETGRYFSDITADDFSYENIYNKRPVGKERIFAPTEPAEKPQTVTEFETDPEVIKNFEIVTDYLAQNQTFMSALLDPASIGDNEDVSEFLRDDVIRIGTKLNKAAKLEEAPDEVVNAYRFIQERFDKSELTGLSEHLEAFVDYGTDVIANPETLLSVLAAVFSRGKSLDKTAVAHTGARAALAKVLNRSAAAINPTTVRGGATYGGIFAGADNLAQQQLDIVLGKREDLSLLETGITTAIGGVIGAGAVKLPDLYRWGKSTINARRANKAMDDEWEDMGFAEDFQQRAKRAFDAAREKETGTFKPSDSTEIVEDYIPTYAPTMLEDLSEGLASKTLDPEDIVNNPQFASLVEDLGGGQKTTDELIDAAIAAAQQGSKEKINSYLMNKLYRMYANTTSGFMGGKASGVFSPYTSYSGAAKVLQQKFTSEFGKTWTGPQATLAADFAETQRKITGKYYVDFLNIVEPIAHNKLKGTMKDDVNAQLSAAIRGKFTNSRAVNSAAVQIKRVYEELGDLLSEAKIIDHKVDNYVPRMWDRKAIQNNPEKLASLLVEEGEAKTLQEAKDIITEMLDKSNQLDSGTHGHFFSAKRKFENITDDAKFEEFLNNDVVSSFYSYIYQAGKSLAKKQVFGVRNENEFNSRWIQRIADDHLKATGKALPKAERERMLQTYRLATSENLDRYGDGLQNTVDGYNFVTRVATLGLATLSSLSEVLVNISKAGVIDSAKGFGDALEVSFNRLTKNTHKELMSKHGLTAQEAWRELYEHSIAIDHGLSQVGNRLAGDDLMNDSLQNASNKFFRVTLLDQWTKFAQLTSFSTGKRLIQNNIKDIAEHGNGKVTRSIQNKKDELAELGIDIDEAVNWYKNGADFNGEFYQTIKDGAARYTNSIVLQPTSMSSLKPRLYSNPKTSMLFNLLSYPAAFSNTILKGAAKQLVRNPTSNLAKVATAGILMTETQRIINFYRSRGQSEEGKTPTEARIAAVKRWGGNGLLFDQLERAQKTAMYSGKAASYVLAPFGPLPSDIINLYNRPASTLGTKVPFYSAGNLVLGPEAMDEYRQSLKELDSEIRKATPKVPTDVKRDMFAKGGEVNVPNAPKEPDERIDKMTGVPYNVQAGSAFVDEEDPIKSLLG